MPSRPNRNRVESPLTLAIDFDGVIHDHMRPRPGKTMGAPILGAVEAVRRLHDRGFKVVIHTTKARTANGTKAVEDWLDFWECPYHEVTAIKPDAEYYIDNKGLAFTDWRRTLGVIYGSLGIDDELQTAEEQKPKAKRMREPENFSDLETRRDEQLELDKATPPPPSKDLYTNMNDLYSTFYEDDEEGEDDVPL